MNIVVLAGGLSPERDVSLASGLVARDTLRSLGHRAVLLDIYLGLEEHIEDIDAVFDRDISYPGSQAIERQEPDLELVKSWRVDNSPALIGPNVLTLCRAADIVFLALHGAIGENGKLQGAFDVLGVKYTGSGPVGSALAMDKDLSKQLFLHNNLLTPAGRVLRRDEAADVNNFSYPCMVKPCSGGSSIGATLVNTAAELPAALDKAFCFEQKVLVEQFISGREFSVGVLQGRALPLIEICPAGEFFDYVNKYQAQTSREICPAQVDEAVAQRMQQLALQAFRVLELDVYARMDFILTASGEIYILEANTLPGLTAASLLPQEAAAVGIDYRSLCTIIIEESLAKRA